MAYLLSFKLEKKELFDAFWVGFSSGNVPTFKTIETALELKKEIIANSIEGGSIKLALCPCCGQRFAEYAKLRTINKDFNVIIDNEMFIYLKSCFDSWTRVTEDLIEYFVEIKQMFDSMKSKSPNEWKKILEDG